MQLWFARSEVTIREQLVTQVILGILSDDLAPGQRLPSTRELARRFRLHPNTVTAGYRQLERERWVEFRHGSGVYVRERKPDLVPSSALTLDFRSVPTSLAGWLPVPSGTLIGIASAWPDFLTLARTMLNAAGFHPDALVFRDARKANWHRGLKQTAAVVCDSVTATELRRLPRNSLPLVIRVFDRRA